MLMINSTNVNTAPRPKKARLSKRSSMRQSIPLCALLSVAFLWGCQAGTDSSSEQKTELPANLVNCPENRPEVCTQQYDPVCGFAAPGVPLGDGQSSGKEWASDDAVEPNPHRTFGNACSACGKPEVVGYTPGACEENAE